MPRSSEKQKNKIFWCGKWELPAKQCQLYCQPCADQPTLVSWHSYLLCWSTIIIYSSEPFGINIYCFNSLLLGIQIFIKVYFDRLCLVKELSKVCTAIEVLAKGIFNIQPLPSILYLTSICQILPFPCFLKCNL